MNCESDTVELANSMGFAVARFNRLEFAHDNEICDRTGGIYDLCPEHTSFTAISAWAWGYTVAMDALERIPFADVENVGITGHSRGGKTVLLAAAAPPPSISRLTPSRRSALSLIGNNF